MELDLINSNENQEKPEPTITTYKIKPALQHCFKANIIKGIIHDVLLEKLQGKVYHVDEAKKWTQDICDTVNISITQRVVMPRYKYLVQVMLGQQTGAGCHYYAKCCWDAESDSYTSDIFHNSSLFCVCTVFGVYLY